MSHVSLRNDKTAPAASAELLRQIERAMGAQPAMFQAVANSPAALKSMWGSFGALGGGQLPASLTEQLAVAIANRNRCGYCLAAHTALGRGAGLDLNTLAEAQRGRSRDPRTQAALDFVLKLVDARGAVGAADVATLRAAGFDDEAVLELIAHTALNLYTNYVNIALDVPIDFEPVALAA
jgi:uncharacterized peroxidase-related enzyme